MLDMLHSKKLAAEKRASLIGATPPRPAEEEEIFSSRVLMEAEYGVYNCSSVITKPPD